MIATPCSLRDSCGQLIQARHQSRIMMYIEGN